MEPEQFYGVDLEVWPTSIVVPKGYRLSLSIRGKDFEFKGMPGRMLHNDPVDRPVETFDAMNKILSGPDSSSYILLPMIP